MVQTGKKSTSGDEIQSVVLAFSILELLAKSEGMKGVTQIAAELGVPKARIFRHLRTLVGLGYVEQDAESEKYFASMKLFLIGSEIGNSIDFLSVSRPVMRELRDTLGHSVTISTIGPDSVRVLDMIRGTSPFEIGTKPGSEFALHATAQGKVALAFGAPERCDIYLRKSLHSFTQNTIVDETRLRRAVDRTRQRGWAVAPGEILIGINALAAPIFDSDGELAGTIAIVDSVQNLPPNPESKQVESVTMAAESISQSLGFQPDSDRAGAHAGVAGGRR